MSWSDALMLQLSLEGGYVYTNDPNDAGGQTYAGLTLRDLEEQAPELAKVFPKIANVDVANYYRKWYWDTTPAQVCPEPADSVLFQLACNVGAKRAVMILQACLLVSPDGEFGPESEMALRYIKGMELAQRLLAAQLTFYATHPNPERRGLVDRVRKVMKSEAYQGKTR